MLRDALLATAGRLDLAMFGPGTLDESGRRRSIYLTMKRSKLLPLLIQFDAPDGVQGIGRRVPTTVAPQALLMMNHPLVRDCARDFAARMAAKGEGEGIAEAFRLAFGRAPTAEEQAAARAFVAKDPGRGRIDFCQALLAANEFAYVD